MGLFGELDAAEVSDDPFYVAPDAYKCCLTDITLVTANSGNRGLSLKWTIEEDESDYNKLNIPDWINVYLNDEDAKDETSLRRDRARLKQRLTTLGLSYSDMNNLVVENEEGNPVINEEIADRFIGVYAIVTTKETESKTEEGKKYINVVKVELTEE